MRRTMFVLAHAAYCSIATLLWPLPVAGQACATKVYDEVADFESGFAINVDTDSGIALEVNAIPKPLPHLWVAKSEVDTIVRIDTDTGGIAGEYWTRPSGRDGNPSRTTVSLLGNAFATNRDESSHVDGIPMGSVVSVGVVVGGTRVTQSGVPDPYGRYIAPPFEYCTCVDRDNDGFIRTSVGRNQLGEPDVLAWPGTGDDWRGGGLCSTSGGGVCPWAEGDGQDAQPGPMRPRIGVPSQWHYYRKSGGCPGCRGIGMVSPDL